LIIESLKNDLSLSMIKKIGKLVFSFSITIMANTYTAFLTFIKKRLK